MTSSISRRSALAALTIPALAACSRSDHNSAHLVKATRIPPTTTKPVSPHPTPSSTHPVAPSNYHTMQIPDVGAIHSIPAAGRQVAITIDDGIRPDVIAAYAAASEKTGLRVTFFANGQYDSWRQEKTAVMKGIESGRIVIGNHTFSHPWLTKSSDAKIARELLKNEKHFKNLYGIDLKPFVRPPYGATTPRINRLLHELGYDAVVLWNGTFGDDQNISSAKVMSDARQYLAPGNIVIGHANHPGVLSDMTPLTNLIAARKLTTVTVKDVMVS